MPTTRQQAWKKLVWRRSVIVISIATVFLSTSTFWWDEFFPSLTRPHLAVFLHAIALWYWVIGGLLLIIVLVVEEALKAINESEARLEEHTARTAMPNVSIVVHQTRIIASLGYIVTVLSVRNTGAPSIVDRWSMTLGDYPEQKVHKVTLTDDLIRPTSNGQSVTYYAVDQLPKKVAEQPIPAGGKKVGWMLWKVPDFDLKSLIKDTTAVVELNITARDVMGKLITAENKAGSHDDISAYYPGMSLPDGSKAH
jgi:hypothetical protein